MLQKQTFLKLFNISIFFDPVAADKLSDISCPSSWGRSPSLVFSLSQVYFPLRLPTTSHYSNAAYPSSILKAQSIDNVIRFVF